MDNPDRQSISIDGGPFIIRMDVFRVQEAVNGRVENFIKYEFLFIWQAIQRSGRLGSKNAIRGY